MTDEVADLVLADNDRPEPGAGQRRWPCAPSLLHVHADWMRRLERAGRLDRRSSSCRRQGDRPPPRRGPRGSPRPSWPCCWRTRRSCWPTSCPTPTCRTTRSCAGTCSATSRPRCGRSYRDRMDAHPLRREIVVTQLVNQLVNPAGITFFHRLSGETGATADELARAHAIASEMLRRRGAVPAGARARPPGRRGGADPDAARDPPAGRAGHPLAGQPALAPRRRAHRRAGRHRRAAGGARPARHARPAASTSGCRRAPTQLGASGVPEELALRVGALPTGVQRAGRRRGGAPARARPARGGPGAQRARAAS